MWNNSLITKLREVGYKKLGYKKLGKIQVNILQKEIQKYNKRIIMEKIENEIADFLGVVEMLQEDGIIGQISKEKRKKKKQKNIYKYLKKQEH